MATEEKREVVVLAIATSRRPTVSGLIAEGNLERHGAALSETHRYFSDQGFVRDETAELPVTTEWFSQQLGTEVGRLEVWTKPID